MGHILKLRGLPFSTSNKQILDFIGVDIVDGIDGIKRTLNAQGRWSGAVYIEVFTAEDMKAVLQKDRDSLGSRYIEVMMSDRRSMQYDLDENGMVNPENPGQKETSVVQLRGLPFKCSREDIALFFQGLRIVPNGILIPLDDNGRCKGDGFVEFRSHDDAKQALQKDKEKIGHRYIELFSSTRLKMMNARKEFGNQVINHRGNPYERPHNRLSGPRLPPPRRIPDIPPFPGRAPHPGRMEVDYPPFPGRIPPRDILSAFPGPSGRSAAHDIPPFPGSRLAGDLRSPHREREMPMPRMAGDLGFEGRLGRPFGHGDHHDGGFERDGFRKKGHEERHAGGDGPKGDYPVYMKNLPFKVTDFDMRSFFDPIKPISISREQRDGRFSGNAFVNFRSYKDAQEAISSKNMEKLGERPITLQYIGVGIGSLGQPSPPPREAEIKQEHGVHPPMDLQRRRTPPPQSNGGGVPIMDSNTATAVKTALNILMTAGVLDQLTNMANPDGAGRGPPMSREPYPADDHMMRRPMMRGRPGPGPPGPMRRQRGRPGMGRY